MRFFNSRESGRGIRSTIPVLLGITALLTSSSTIQEYEIGQVGVTKGSFPNVLLISVDDLNDWVGVLQGHHNTLTPNIDRLARKGVVFTDAHASSPICGPSRAALLSGIRASTSGFHDNSSQFTAHPILMENENLPQFFKRLGYRTFSSGKVFHDYYPEFWDESIPKGPRMYNAGDPKLNELEITGIFDWGPLEIPDHEMDDYKMVQFGIDWLKASHKQPFFIACGIYLPHLPWYAPKEYFTPFPLESLIMPITNPHDSEDLPRTALSLINNSYQDLVRKLSPENQKKAVQSYLASTHFADAQVGRLLDALEKSSYADNTIVVLFGDNGNHHGQKSRWHKDTMWRESTRVPFIIYVPGAAGNGEICTRVTSLLDIYPTLADLLGVKAPLHLEGISLKPLLEDPGSEWNHAVITNRRPGQYAVRTSDWCYIRYQDGGEELYDRYNDPREWMNLADDSQYAGIKRKMAERIPGGGGVK
jgi:arylsulfatase A-like enzyme